MTVTLGQAKEILLACLRTERTGVRCPVLLLGPPGQGKTSIVEHLSEELPEVDGMPLRVVSFRLSQSDPLDIKGIPYLIGTEEREKDKDREGEGVKRCSFAPPSIFPLIGDKGKEFVVIFLDELPQAPPTMQNLAANLIDGVVGDHRIDFKRCFICAAGNRVTDGSAAFSIPRNVVNRLVILEVVTALDEWVDWAIAHDLHPAVVGFVKAHPSEFNYLPDDKKDIGKVVQFASPRSLERLSALLQGRGDAFLLSDLGVAMIAGTVGEGMGAKFVAFLKKFRTNWCVEKILAGEVKETPTESDLIYSLVLSLAYYVKNLPSLRKREGLSEKDKETLLNALEWVARLDVAYQALFRGYLPANQLGYLMSTLSQEKGRLGKALSTIFKAGV